MNILQLLTLYTPSAYRPVN